MIKVSVPATCANIGPGFDVFGMALGLYNYIWIEDESNGFSLEIEGEGADVLPNTSENLMVKAFTSIYKGDLGKFSIRFQNNIPLARGLGSSATAIIGGLFAANTLLGNIYTKEELLERAISIEGHPDNVTPSVLGGFTISYKVGGKYKNIRIDPPDLYVYLIIPDYKLETEKMRRVLPDAYKREDVIYNISRASLVVSAFLRDDFSLLLDALFDKIHEPYRGKFINGYFELKDNLYREGNSICTISGSGPTISCFSKKDNLEDLIKEYIVKYNMKAKIIKTNPSMYGVKVETL